MTIKHTKRRIPMKAPAGGGGPGGFRETRIPGPMGRAPLLIEFAPLVKWVEDALSRDIKWVEDAFSREWRSIGRKLGITRGSVTKLTDADFQAAAQALGPGVSVAIIRAFAEVESGGKSGFGQDGLPIIAYEGHQFRKFTNNKYDKSYPFLSYRYVKKAGPEWRHNNKDQQKAWETLRAAMALNHDAALQSCSWGMFQVMGFNYKMCGYKDVDDFVAAMKGGERGQLDAFVGYCKSTPGLRKALAEKKYKEIARLYNGKDYGDYDRHIEKAYKKYGGA